MPAKMHKQKVGANGHEIYRYMMNCRACVSWQKGVKGHYGICSKHNKRIAGQTLSCDSFVAKDDVELLLKSAAIDKDLILVQIGTKTYYCTPQEIDEITAFILSL